MGLEVGIWGSGSDKSDREESGRGIPDGSDVHAKPLDLPALRERPAARLRGSRQPGGMPHVKKDQLLSRGRQIPFWHAMDAWRRRQSKWGEGFGSGGKVEEMMKRSDNIVGIRSKRRCVN